MNKVIKYILLLSLMLGTTYYFSGYFNKNSNDSEISIDKVSLRLPIPVKDTSFAPYYLAIDKGIFKKYGLEVTLEPGTPELNPVKMVSQGIDQFGVLGGPELLFSGRDKGASIVGISLLHDDSDFVVILTKKESGITKLADLENKSVGMFFGHISTDVLRMLFKNEGVNIKEVDVGFDYGSFLTGEIDAQWAFRTTAGISLPAKGVEINVISPASYGLETNGHMLIVNEKLMKSNPALVQKFTSAVIEAIIYSLDHVDEAIEATVAREPNFSPEIGAKQLKIYNKTIRNNKSIGWIEAADMHRVKQQMVSSGLLKDTFNLDSAYTTQFLSDEK